MSSSTPLEERIQQLIKLAEQLRSENGELRQQLVVTQNENKLLRDRVTVARSRLENLVGQIPEAGD
ncbi:MAG: hypothetical protein KIT73_01110 [Burkholderiales bacterium]|nr:hypothetical protein [Burkholderiales bacterium]